MKKEKHVVISFVIACVLLSAIIVIAVINEINRDKELKQGVALLNSGNYAEAAECFEAFVLKNKNDVNTFTISYFVNYLKCKDNDLAGEKYYIESISDYYSGVLADEIHAEKAAFKEKYAEHMNTLRAEVNEAPDKYRDTVPFVGMNALYIDKTYLGMHNKVEKGYRRSGNIEYDTYTYTFWTVYGELLIMEVTCTDYVTESVVTNVRKYNEATLWQNGLPNIVASKYKEKEEPSSNNSPSYHGSRDEYEYSYDDYSDFEDFYYDNQEDFAGLDDAEDYFDEYMDDYAW